MTTKIFAAAIAALFTVNAAHAALQDTKNRKEGLKHLEECSKEATGLFGFKVELDAKDLEKSKEYTEGGLTHYSVADRCCSDVLGTFKEIGGDEDGKAAIKKKVKTVVCHFDPKVDKKERSEGTASFSGGKAIVGYTQNTSFSYNSDNWLKKWLMANLD